MRKHLYAAYWINPRGDHLPVPIHHISVVIDHPEVFNLTREHVLAVYEKYGEKIGLEGRAREEIMLDLLKKGWIRLRENPKKHCWKCQVWRFTDREHSLIGTWVRHMTEQVNGFEHYALEIIDTREQTRTLFSMKE